MSIRSILKTAFHLSLLLLPVLLYSQSLKPVAVIEYGLDEGGILVPYSKKGFLYDDRLNIISESQYENLGLNELPNWRINHKVDQQYNDQKSRTLHINERYYYTEQSQSIIETYITETATSYNANGDIETHKFTNLSRDKDGRIQSFSAFKTDRRYNEDGCLYELIESWSNDPDIEESQFEQNASTEYITDPLCRNLFVNQYINNVLLRTTEIVYDDAGDISFQEEIAYDAQGDERETFRQIREKDIYGRVIVSRLEVEIDAVGEVGYSETRYAYSDLAVPDSVFVENRFQGYENRSLTTYEYDSEDRVRLSRSFVYPFDNSDELILTYETVTDYDAKDRVDFQSFARHDELGILENEGFTTTEYHKDELQLRRITESVLYSNGEIVSESISIEENTYNCDDLLKESNLTQNGVLTQRTEYIYPISSSCESNNDDFRVSFVSNNNTLTIWSNFLTGQYVKVQFISVDGRVVRQIDTEAQLHTSLAMGDLADGIYFVSLSTESAQVSESLIIVR